MPNDAKDAGPRAALPAYPAVAVAVRGDDRFVGDGTGLDMFQGLVSQAKSAGIPRRDWAGIRPTLAELFSCAAGTDARNRQIVAAKEDWGFTRKEIAEFLGLHAETVTRTVRQQRRRAEEQEPGPAPDA